MLLLLLLLAASRHLPRAFLEAFGLFSSFQKQLEHPYPWSLGELVACGGYSPPSMPLPHSFFPSLRLRLSIPPKLCHHRCMLHICVETPSPRSKGPSVLFTLLASQTHYSISGWVLQV